MSEPEPPAAMKASAGCDVGGAGGAGGLPMLLALLGLAFVLRARTYIR